jgi:quaternary ammonium compound-resistance protein SugE
MSTVMNSLGAWLVLGLAGVCEIVWAVAMKYADGWTKLWPSVITVIFASASFWLLALALRSIPMSVGYAVWVGIGAVGVALVGMIFLQESVNAGKIFSIIAIVVGIIGLKLT